MSDSSESPHPATRAREPSGPMCVFVDAEGMRWQVSERPFSDYDRRRGLSLIFASDSAVRRVREYPDNWHALSDAELAALSWKA